MKEWREVCVNIFGKIELEHYASELQREYDEVENVPGKENEEIKDIFKDYWLSEKAQNMIVDELAADKHKWVNFRWNMNWDWSSQM